LLRDVVLLLLLRDVCLCATAAVMPMAPISAAAGRGKTFLCNKLKCYLNWCAVVCVWKGGVRARALLLCCRRLLLCRLLPLTVLDRLGHPTAHFNVGQYRRREKDKGDVQDAAFFDHNNPVCR
jgi:6-phosphofructo-2-kinase/fructose-2,6-biphosphatase